MRFGRCWQTLNPNPETLNPKLQEVQNRDFSIRLDNKELLGA